MKKIRNETENSIKDELRGFSKIYKDKIRLAKNGTAVLRAHAKEQGKVKLVMGNGGGHEPAVIGWVGDGIFDCDVVGEVFAAPSGDKLYKVLEEIDDKSPILLCVQNHAGDVINANIAYKKAKKAGMDIHKVLFYDDIASAPKEEITERRGIAGMLFYAKIVGALAEEGVGVEECIDMFERVRDRTRTYAAAYSSCTHPESGQKMFEYLEGNDLLELGMGVHGEGGGGNRIPMPTAQRLAELMGQELINDGEYQAGQEILVLVNGTGGSTAMELNIFYNELEKFFAGRGLTVVGCSVGNYLTTQELAGVSVSVCEVDGRMKELWERPCNCPLWVTS